MGAAFVFAVCILKHNNARINVVHVLPIHQHVTKKLHKISTKNIKIRLLLDRHLGCPKEFDGPAGALAHVLPRGDIHLDDSEPWKEDNGEDGINLQKVRQLLSLLIVQNLIIINRIISVYSSEAAMLYYFSWLLKSNSSQRLKLRLNSILQNSYFLFKYHYQGQAWREMIKLK